MSGAGNIILNLGMSEVSRVNRDNNSSNWSYIDICISVILLGRKKVKYTLDKAFANTNGSSS